MILWVFNEKYWKYNFSILCCHLFDFELAVQIREKNSLSESLPLGWSLFERIFFLVSSWEILVAGMFAFFFRWRGTLIVHTFLHNVQHSVHIYTFIHFAQNVFFSPLIFFFILLFISHRMHSLKVTSKIRWFNPILYAYACMPCLRLFSVVLSIYLFLCNLNFVFSIALCILFQSQKSTVTYGS